MLFFLLLIPSTFAAQCGPNTLPFSLEVLQGNTILGCSRPHCFGWSSNGAPLENLAQFSEIPGGLPDGFLTSEVQNVPPFNPQENFEQSAVCELGFPSETCSDGQWIGGVAPASTSDLKLQCCYSSLLRESRDLGVATVSSGQIYVGGEVLENGQRFFDVITNIQRTSDDVAYSVSIRRISCPNVTPLPPPVPAPGPYFGPSGFGAPAGLQNYYCFSSDSTVQLSTGSQIQITDLQVGDYVLSMTNGQNGNFEYSRVDYFLHRNLNKTAEFLRIRVQDGSEITLTHKHYLYANWCKSRETMKMMKAEDVREGMCLQKSDQKASRISSIREYTGKGFFAPQTSSGNIFINGIFASCASEVGVDFLNLQQYFFKNLVDLLKDTIIFDQTLRELSWIGFLLDFVKVTL